MGGGFDVRAFAVPSQRGYNAGVKLFPLSCGAIAIPDDYLRPALGQAGAFRWATVGMFVIEHPRGVVLFDTGSAPEVAADAAAHWGAEVAAAFPVRLDRDAIIDRQLAVLGYAPQDVRHIVLSHLHLDHAGGLKLFPGATVHVQGRELADAMWPPAGFEEGYYLLADLLPTRRFDVVKLDGDHDLFGDGSIRLLATPGHTAGHMSMHLTLPVTGPVILPADACFHPQALAEGLPPGWPLPCPERWEDSLLRVVRAVEAGALPLYSHVPLDEQPLPTGPLT